MKFTNEHGLEIVVPICGTHGYGACTEGTRNICVYCSKPGAVVPMKNGPMSAFFPHFICPKCGRTESNDD